MSLENSPFWPDAVTWYTIQATDTTTSAGEEATVPFSYINSKGRTYYAHVTITGPGEHAGQARYYFSRLPERALPHLPPGFVVGGEVPGTSVPVLRKITPVFAPSELVPSRATGALARRHPALSDKDAKRAS
jgi:hypothetical protein